MLDTTKKNVKSAVNCFITAIAVSAVYPILKNRGSESIVDAVVIFCIALATTIGFCYLANSLTDAIFKKK